MKHRSLSLHPQTPPQTDLHAASDAVSSLSAATVHLMRRRLRAGLWAWGRQQQCERLTAQHCAGPGDSINRVRS